eukprot:CAMPEP_0114976674 /NCGR_PEP_ID=MMETSP0216-20121206/2806_1 /TAXON_ID=223996 /ORGANISM="Protocruzia adherens, Strain Boccale" /LENGTH=501 /DNA_ID=CAMNT_0002337633 /DNA_START=38 /DNA_END=1543 /DNA_ORIENTATION=-
MDPFFLAMQKYRRRKYDECIEMCDQLLEKNDRDQAAWFMKTRALTRKNWIDDIEVDEEGVGDILMDENATQAVPRPGTSFTRPMTGSQGGNGPSQIVRPNTKSGRPVSGFQRAGDRPTTNRGGSLEDAMRGDRPGTNRAVTSSGRLVRLGTASMRQMGGKFIDPDKINLKQTAQRKHMSKIICDYLIYFEHNPRKALELAAESTVLSDYKDWWWKARLGKVYFQMGLLRDAEKQFRSSLKEQDMISTHLELAKVYIKLDQPTTALEIYNKALEKFPEETSFMLGISRIYEMLNDSTHALPFYKRVLQYDGVNVEAVASLAAFHFYTDQPEIALRFYRRLIQIGLNSTELWNNLGLCCFHAAQYDLCLECFDRALELADDTNIADVWYNIGQVGVGIGDLGFAYQAFKIAISADNNHAESFNNLGVLELRKGNIDQARSNFQTSMRLVDYLFEPYYNGSLLAYKTGDFQDGYQLCKKSIGIYEEHVDSQELLKNLEHHFSAV